ncbi:hypothetical protein ACG2QI_09490 [Bacillus sp. GM2]|uniref:hypothetical protein n=1 Tax=Bacillus TaxID=1386 RepID=UPI00092910C6|nr:MULTISPECIES: hypothetical protein [Bacillus subtilis group]MSO00820.1 hypothetical protein [Bacillus paralicheniformis]MSO04828.1 hypothetical protein [Bacillus paralicheniformis]MSO08821.1 hypothetical protein [Bacillus paralicheniformis]MSO12815.1 hypothetical protein [Bacillus paralicheniformis]NJE39312.1 hypothetical protein [Bacillus paralicheniformis]
MNKFYKGLIVSALSISSLALPALTNQASAQEPAQIKQVVKPADAIATVDFHMLRNSNVLLLNGYTRWEIVSGSHLISISPGGVVSSHSSLGTALVYAYDINDNYVIYKITVEPR